MPEEIRLRRDPGLPFQEIEGQAVIIFPRLREMHELDEVGTFLWRQLQKGRTVGELVEAVCEEFEVPEGEAEKDIRAFLRTLEEKKLVVRA